MRSRSCPVLPASCLKGSDGGVFSSSNANTATIGVDSQHLGQHGHRTEYNRVLLRRHQREFRDRRRRRTPMVVRRTTVPSRCSSPVRRLVRCNGKWAAAATDSPPGSIPSAPAPARVSGRGTTAAQSAVACRTAGWVAAAARAGALAMAAGARDTQSFVLPYDLFHGGIPGGDDCGPAGATTGCGNLIAGSTRVWETITGATATNTWVVTNNPATQNMTKQSLGNRSFINQVKYSPKFKSVGDCRHERRQCLDRIQPRHRGRERGQLGQRDRQQHRAGESSGARHRARSDGGDCRRAGRLRGRWRFQRHDSDDAGPRLPRRLRYKLQQLHLAG